LFTTDPQDLTSTTGGEVTALTILIVDDDADMRLYLRSCLRSLAGRVERVIEAADGLEALPLARSGLVHVVITDVVMPHVNGYCLCRTIKEDPDLRHIVVLLVSGEDGSPPAAVAADGFLAKPFNASQLQAALERLLPGLPRAPPNTASEPR
jgi:CheY-like chemotaxis protein